jgi:hypothetical protein
MSQHVTTTASIPRPHRTTLVVAVFTVLALGVGVAVAALDGSRSGSTVHRSAYVPMPAADGAASQVCGTDLTNVFATIAAMPGDVAAQVVRALSPELSQFVDSSAMFGASAGTLPAPPDTSTLGDLLARLDRVDRNAIMSGLPGEQQAAVAAAEESAAFSYLLAQPPACR